MHAVLSPQLQGKATIWNHAQQLSWSLFLPAPGTILVVSGHLDYAAMVTLLLSLVAAFQRGKATNYDPTAGRYSTGLDTILFVIVAIISAVVLGLQTSPTDGKLFRLSFTGFAGEEDIRNSFLVLLWTLCLSTVPILHRAHPDTSSIGAGFNKNTAVAMATLGATGLLLSLTVSRQEVFASRGESSGNGLNSFLYWSAATFVAYVIVTHTTKGSRVFPLLAGLMTVGLMATGNRSPIALLLIAVLVRIIWRNRRGTLRLAILLSPLALVLLSYQSVWRARVSRGLPSSPKDVFQILISEPLQQFLHMGLDTVDGHILTRAILSAGYSAHWSDPLLAVTNFIPRQIWSQKPILLGSQIGHDYLGLTAGGIFLSGPGYFSLVTGSVFLGSAVFIILIMLIKSILIIPSLPPLAVCALFYLAVRISIAGDAFDIFLSLQVLVIFGLSTLLGKVYRGRDPHSLHS